MTKQKEFMAKLAAMTEEDVAALKARIPKERQDFISALTAGFAPVIKEFVETKIAEATAPLLQKIAELENRPRVQYRGVWKEGQPYGTGSMVTYEGSVWHANRATMKRPGDGAD